MRDLRLFVEARTTEDADQAALRLFPIRSSLLETLTSIEGFLRWGQHPETHTPKRSPREPGEADENEDGTKQRQHLPTGWRMPKSRRQKLVNLDNDPEENLLSTGIAQVEAEAAAARKSQAHVRSL